VQTIPASAELRTQTVDYKQAIPRFLSDIFGN
jgi:hypothetical protein